MERLKLNGSEVCIAGLGYVGLPLAQAFSKNLKVTGYDNDKEKVRELKETGSRNLVFTDNPEEIGEADFIIICVPTPITGSKEPDLTHIRDIAGIIGQNMKRGSTVILESTVYPGVTEEIVMPILENESGLKCGADFKIGYSPERINPGDEEHSVDRVTKVVAGMDEGTTELLAELYGKITPHIFRAKNIKTAEAAKVIENIQRDLNIALVNEFAIIFEKMGLSTRDILEAAATKWNFHTYYPGLVGGHCIPVDPYYLVYKSRELDYNPQVILAGRTINDNMPRYVARMTIEALKTLDKVMKGARVLIMGLTYKENVADTRETPVKEIIKELREQGIEIWGYDPLLSNIREEFDIKVVETLEDAPEADAVIFTVAHDSFREINISEFTKHLNQKAVLVDLKQIFDRDDAERSGLYYLTL